MKFIARLGLTFITIPKVIRIKYKTNSEGFLTGVLNLTIDKAPTIPRERAILFDITEVIINPAKGRNRKLKSFSGDSTLK